MRLLHLEGTSSRRNGIEVKGVFQYFGHGRLCLYDLVFTFTVHSKDPSPAAVKISHHITHVFFRHHYFHFHYGFEQDRGGFLNALFKAHAGSDFKGHF